MFEDRSRSSNTFYSLSAPRSVSQERRRRDEGDVDAERRRQGSKDERESEWFLEDVADGEISPRWHPSEPGGGGFEFTVRPFTSKQRLMPKSTSSGGTEWKSIADEEEGDLDDQRFSLVSIMEPSKRDLPIDLKRMSMLWTHGNIFRALPSPTTNSPPLSSDSEVPPTQSIPLTPARAPQLNITTTITVHSPSPSPISAVVSASATWSILEMYGVSPESPMTERPSSHQFTSKPVSSPFPQVPSASNEPSLSITAQPPSNIPPVPPIPPHLRSWSKQSIRPLPVAPPPCPASTSKHVPSQPQLSRTLVLHGPRPRSSTLPANRRQVMEAIQMPSPGISDPGGRCIASTFPDTPESATRRRGLLAVKTGDQRG
ncbi:uncharacterized protein BT62DRAFT_922905 [Guyanagaster necrorhizus]|uniref:Uncharacterized protein n=1 Tax=Guyanagaster necrorhizus TaxID=856835 RepID=A0A9P7VK71_9AGAR|nr:uncharacterized protein BT62DRAFT_922905 [Guyanagaster necrorhizus MCA 3950]KAG7442088.1 hypothetical protein BT62DRAFT_922905 [Guyanagaster necrorhizus MCA 3950]